MSNEKVQLNDLKLLVFEKLRKQEKKLYKDDDTKKKKLLFRFVDEEVKRILTKNLLNSDEVTRYKIGLCDEDLVKCLNQEVIDYEKFKLTYSDKEHAWETFFFTDVAPIIKRRDLFSIYVGYYGYNDFLKRQIPSDLYKKDISPLDYKPLAKFFENGCYVFAFNENMVRNERLATSKKIEFPKVDALKLILNEDNQTFELENNDNNRTHRKGIISWCKNSSGDNNAFDIHFLDSSTQLILRIHFPFVNYKELPDEKVNLLCGAFMFCRKKGHVAVGTVLLYKNENNTIRPFTYSFDDTYDERIPVSILKYLYDRNQNWIKIPYNIHNLDQFDNWLQEQHNHNYTYNQIKERDFLIFHPNSSIAKSIFKKFKKSIKEFCDEPHKFLEEECLKGIKFQDAFIEYCSKTFNNKGIEIHDVGAKEPLGNSKLLKKISRSLNTIFVIPNVKLSRISSIYTAIGYSIALKKNTYIFFEEGVERSKLLKENEPSTRIFIYEYSDVSEIPNILTNTAMKDKWLAKMVERSERNAFRNKNS